jgi:hypothetical protein
MFHPDVLHRRRMSTSLLLLCRLLLLLLLLLWLSQLLNVCKRVCASVRTLRLLVHKRRYPREPIGTWHKLAGINELTNRRDTTSHQKLVKLITCLVVCDHVRLEAHLIHPEVMFAYLLFLFVLQSLFVASTSDIIFFIMLKHNEISLTKKNSFNFSFCKRKTMGSGFSFFDANKFPLGDYIVVTKTVSGAGEKYEIEAMTRERANDGHIVVHLHGTNIKGDNDAIFHFRDDVPKELDIEYLIAGKRTGGTTKASADIVQHVSRVDMEQQLGAAATANSKSIALYAKYERAREKNPVLNAVTDHVDQTALAKQRQF